MGTPDVDDRDKAKEEGWVRTAYDANVTIVRCSASCGMGSPDGLTARELQHPCTRSSLRRARCFRNFNPQEDTADFDAIRPARGEVVWFSAGHHAKTMITELMHPVYRRDRKIFSSMRVRHLMVLLGFNPVISTLRKRPNASTASPARGIKFWLDPRWEQCAEVSIYRSRTTTLI